MAQAGREVPLVRSSPPGVLVAESLSNALQQEFGVPFDVYDKASGLRLSGSPGEQTPEDGNWHAGLLHDIPTNVPVRVHVEPGVGFRLCLEALVDGNLPVVATGIVPITVAGSEPTKTMLKHHQRLLLRWLSAVSDRLRLENQLRIEQRRERVQAFHASTAWKALMSLSNLARRLRAHKGSKGSQQQILKAAYGLAQVESILWVPLQPDVPHMMEGNDLLAPEEVKQLGHALATSPQLKAPAPLFFNRVAMASWGWRFPQLRNMIAFLVTDHEPVGWFIVLNKRGNAHFKRSDAGLLLPFVALLELHLRWSHRNQDLKSLLLGLTRSLTNALDAKDAYTSGHSERVARIAVELGKEMGLGSEELGRLYLAGLLHDVGKIGIKDDLLQKREALTPAEQEQLRQHVMIGYWILSELRPIRHLLPGVLYHHERIDGTGYPAGLSRDDIPLLARILAVADAYDAMSQKRPYRDSLPYHRVEAILLDGAGTQWDREVVEAFMNCNQRIRAISKGHVSGALRQAIETSLQSTLQSGLNGPHRSLVRTSAAPSRSPALPEI